MKSRIIGLVAGLLVVWLASVAAGSTQSSGTDYPDSPKVGFGN
jgi:hypothetical protein